MEKRLLLFVPLAFIILYISLVLEAQKKAANQPAGNVAAQKNPGKEANAKGPPDKAAGDKAAGDKAAGDKAAGDKNPGNAEKPGGGKKPDVKPAEEDKQIPGQWFTLGGADPFVMLVTFTSQGAAVERVELTDPRYRDADPENRYGYLGHLALVADRQEKGCRVNVVGDGTPAALAGLKPRKVNEKGEVIDEGDVIVELNGVKTPTPPDLLEALKSTKPGDTVPLTVHRGGADVKLKATLAWRPLAVIRPEFKTDPLEQSVDAKHDPLSYLLTLAAIDNDSIPAESDPLKAEIEGLHLRSGNWEGKQIGNDTVEFSRFLPRWDLRIVKRYQLAKLDKAKPDEPVYHLTLQVEIRNEGKAAHTVAYQLDGATGLPTEGWWYATRVTPGFTGYALRDVALRLQDKPTDLISTLSIAQQQFAIDEAKAAGKDPPKKDETVLKVQMEGPQLPPLLFAAVDAQYFAAALLPEHVGNFTPWLADIRPVIVGEIPSEIPLRTKINVTSRFTSLASKIEPGDSLKHQYRAFIGPKLPDLLTQYHAQNNPQEDLSGLVYYGWFGWVARPMLFFLEIFHGIVGNYGLAIIMLTIMVRICMFPLSRKQAISAKKMQELQPEMKKLKEKFSGTTPEEKLKLNRAVQELWRKNNINPLGGCLLVFAQLPIFVGLRNLLVVDVQLRQSSLFGESVRWCSNLAAPDMFWNWTGILPGFLTSETGRLLIFPAPGPWLNILPIFTVAIFLWQQSMFMPPPTDDQSAMQQKLMKWMTILMGFAFFKVPAGLCLYFIVSSLWGIGERKLLPKMVGAAPANAAAAQPARSAPAESSNGSAAARRKRQRGRR